MFYDFPRQLRLKQEYMLMARLATKRWKSDASIAEAMAVDTGTSHRAAKEQTDHSKGARKGSCWPHKSIPVEVYHLRQPQQHKHGQAKAKGGRGHPQQVSPVNENQASIRGATRKDPFFAMVGMFSLGRQLRTLSHWHFAHLSLQEGPEEGRQAGEPDPLP